METKYTRNLLLMLLLCLAPNHQVTAQSSSCPAECRISTEEDKKKVDCSGQGLECVPSALDSDTLILDLSKNPIFTLQDDIFKNVSLLQLQQIDLSGHTVDSLGKNTFRGLANLTSVNLSKNRFAKLDSSTFEDNPNLKTLILRYNMFLQLPEDGPFLISPSMNVLDLSFCNINILQPQLFSQLSGVTHLYLEGNKIQAIAKIDFSLLPNLEYLDLSYNLVTNFSEVIFEDHAKLKTLILKYNPMNYTQDDDYDEPDYWYTPNKRIDFSTSKNTTFLKSDSLEVLDVSGCFSHKIPSYTFFCGSPNLKLLNLSSNALVRVVKEHFFCLKELQEIYLIDSNLYTLFPDAFVENPKLWKLVMSQNHWSSMKFGSLVLFDIPSLTYLDLSYDWITRLKAAVFSKMTNLTHLILTSNSLSLFDEEMLSYLDKLEILYLSYSKISSIPLKAFRYNTKLKELYLNGNPLETLPDGTDILDIPVLLRLDLTACFLRNIHPDAFSKLPSLTTLNLGKNPLTYLGNHTLSHLSNLEYLDLSYCNLMYIDSDTFSHNEKLKFLSLRGNALHALQQDVSIVNSLSLKELDLSECNIPHLLANTFANITNLEKLYLEDNELSSVNVSVVSQLKNLQVLELSGNLWRCDCSLKALRDWSLSQKIKQKDLIVCVSPSHMIGWSWAEAGDETCDENQLLSCKQDGGENLPTDTGITKESSTQKQVMTSSRIEETTTLPQTTTKIPPNTQSSTKSEIKTQTQPGKSVTTPLTTESKEPKPTLLTVDSIIGHSKQPQTASYGWLVTRGVAAGFFSFICLAFIIFVTWLFLSKRYQRLRSGSQDYDRTLEIADDAY